MRRALRRSFDWYLRVVQRAALPRLVDVDHEQRRLNLLRVFVGLVVLVLVLRNGSTTPQRVTLPSAQTHDFAVSDGDGRELWRWACRRGWPDA